MTYSPKGVTFDGSQVIKIPSLTCTDNGKFSMAFKCRGQSTNNAGFSNLIFQGDPTASEATFLIIAPNVSNGLDLDLFNAAGTAGLEVEGTAPPLDSFWHKIVISADLTGAGQYAVYVDDALLTLTVEASTLPATPAFNGLPLWVGKDNNSNALKGDIADLWIAPGVSLLQGATIPSSTLAKFDGDPAFYPAGGSVLFSGDASTFATNQLGGGTATLTGTLANAPLGPTDQAIGYNFKYVVASNVSNLATWFDPKSKYVYSVRQTFDGSAYEAVKLDGTTGATVLTAPYLLTDFHDPSPLVGAWTNSQYLYLNDSHNTSGSLFTNRIIRLNKSDLTTSHIFTSGTGENFDKANGIAALTADGAFFARVGDRHGTLPVVSYIELYKTADDTYLYETAATALGTAELMNCVVWDAAGHLWVGCISGNLYECSVDASTLAVTVLNTYAVTGNSINAITNWQPSGKFLIWEDDGAVTDSGWVRQWDPATAATILGPALITTGKGFAPNPWDKAGWFMDANYVHLVAPSGSTTDFYVVAASTLVTTKQPLSLWNQTRELDFARYYQGANPPVFFADMTAGFAVEPYSLGLFFTLAGGGGGSGNGGPGFGGDEPVTVTRTDPIPEVRQLRPFEQVPYAEFRPQTVTSNFPIRFKVVAQTDLRVTVDTVELTQDQFIFAGNIVRFPGWDSADGPAGDPDFLANNNPRPFYKGGVVTLDTPITVGQVVRIWSDPASARTTDFTDGQMKMAQANAAVETLWLLDRAQHLKTYRAPIIATVPDPLPAASAGLRLVYQVNDDPITLVCAGLDTIHDGTSSGTTLAATASGAVIELLSPDKGKWFVRAKGGAWGLT